MNAKTIALMFIVVFVPLWGFVAYKWWKVFNSPDGERLRKRRMQGPLVPLSEEEIADDASRRL